MKVIIDRGHFVMEQLLYGKYGISVTTYENFDGKYTAKVLNKLLSYSGATVSGKIVSRNTFNSNPLQNIKLRKDVHKKINRLYRDISESVDMCFKISNII